MIALLNGGEQIGFYLDSEEPYFRLKIETGHHGHTRCMLLPDSFAEFPEELVGVVRLMKVFAGKRAPYQSVIRADGLAVRGIVNEVLAHSYQVPAVVLLSEDSDQSILLHQLPPLKHEEYDYSLDAVRERREGIRERMGDLFARALLEREEIKQAFAETGFRLLADRPVMFRCSCSRDRMVQGVFATCRGDADQLFDPGQVFLEVVCEYCKAGYRIGREEIEGLASSPPS